MRTFLERYWPVLIVLGLVLAFSPRFLSQPQATSLPVETQDRPTDAEWEALKQWNINLPPKHWSTTAIEPAQQQADFARWGKNTPLILSQVEYEVREWLGSNETIIDKLVTSKTTGAQYRVTGAKHRHGAECRVKFVGNLKWR